MPIGRPGLLESAGFRRTRYRAAVSNLLLQARFRTAMRHSDDKYWVWPPRCVPGGRLTFSDIAFAVQRWPMGSLLTHKSPQRVAGADRRQEA